MSAINLPFAASGARRPPTTGELATGFPCGPADQELFNWLHWYSSSQLAGVITSSGETPDDADGLSLARSVRSQIMNYDALAGGTADAIVANVVPALTAHVAGMPLRVKITAANTGAATLDCGPGALPIKTMRGLDIARGDLPAGGIVSFICTGTAWMVAGLVYSEALIPTVSPVFYVRTDGNNSNDGSANTAGAALATIGEALNRLRRFVLTAVPGQIILGVAGTYTGPGDVNVNGSVTITGDAANQDNYIVQADPTKVAALNVVAGRVTTNGVYCRSAVAGAAVVSANDNGYLSLINTSIQFNAAGGAFLCSAAYGGTVNLGGGCQLRGSADNALRPSTRGVIIIGGAVTYTGSAAFSVNAYASALGIITTTSSGSVSGSATGQRYAAVSNAVIAVGGSSTFFPGSTAGTTATGGQYV